MMIKNKLINSITKQDFNDNFVLERDYITLVVCENCSYNEDFDSNSNPNIIICPNCHKDSLIYTTAHEGLECSNCDRLLDSGSAYRAVIKGEDVILCSDCGSKLEKLLKVNN